MRISGSKINFKSLMISFEYVVSQETPHIGIHHDEDGVLAQGVAI
jgi:hypothetical protein